MVDSAKVVSTKNCLHLKVFRTRALGDCTGSDKWVEHTGRLTLYTLQSTAPSAVTMSRIKSEVRVPLFSNRMVAATSLIAACRLRTCVRSQVHGRRLMLHTNFKVQASCTAPDPVQFHV